MKRLYLAAVAGLCSVVPLSAQEGALAPTAPVVPAPVLQNGSLVSPSGGNGWGAGSRPFAPAKWSPFRNPATASVTDPVVPSAAAYGHALPPLPAGVSGVEAASCGPAGCGQAGRSRGCWEHLKAWLCYHPSKTDLPKCRPTPYVTPLQGMFPCTSVAGCTTGCAVGTPVYGQPQPVPQGLPMPQPVPPGATAGAVMMPPRGQQGTATLQPTWQGRTTPAAQFAAKPATGPTTGPVVGASLTYPAPK